MMKMVTSKEENEPKFSNSGWEYLAEYPLKELLVDMDLRDTPEVGLLFMKVKDLGIKPEILDIIERKLIGFTAESPAQLNQRRFEAPTYVRLFYKRNTADDSNPVDASNRHKSRQTLKSTQIIDHSEPEINGGWGYFLVERGVSSEIGVSLAPLNWIDLYLYKEGE